MLTVEFTLHDLVVRSQRRERGSSPSQNNLESKYRVQRKTPGQMSDLLMHSPKECIRNLSIRGDRKSHSHAPSG